MDFLSRTWTNFGWSLEKEKKIDMEFFIGHKISRNKILGRGKIFIRHGFFFFFFFLGVFWNEYFVSILMIGQLRFAEPQESR